MTSTALAGSWLDEYFRNEISPPLDTPGTGRLDNVNSTVSGLFVSALHFSGVAPDVTGFTAGFPGRRIHVIAAGGPVVLEEESPFSSTVNRIKTGEGNVTVLQGAAAFLVYDGLLQRWVLSLGGGIGPTGPAGADGKTVRSGAGAPAGGLGVDGDFYIDTTAHAIYGPKTSGAWGSSTSLIGPTGATGTAGSNGTNGTNGVDAFTTTSANFTQPAVSSTVSVQVGSTAWMASGQVLYVVGGGYYTVSSITDSTHVVLTNLGYTGNASPAATVTSGGKVSPGGLVGATGASGSGNVTVDVFANRQANASGALFYPTDGGFVQVADGTNWYNVVGGFPLKEPPATATIPTQTNFGTSTLTKTNMCLVFQPQVGTLQVRTSGKTIVTLASAVVTAGVALVAEENGAATANAAGVYMRESGTGKIFTLDVSSPGNTGVNIIAVGIWASATSRSSVNTYAVVCPASAVLLRLAISGSNVLAQASYDGGLNWLTLQTTAKTTAFTTAPNEFGIYCTVASTNTPGPIATFYTLTFAGD